MSNPTYKNNAAMDKFIKDTSNVIRSTKIGYDKLSNIFKNTPLTIKIANIVVPFSICYYFTYISFNLSLSIIFGILTFLVILLLSKMGAIMFIILYIISVANAYQQIQNVIGVPLIETDILRNKLRSPYDATSGSKIISSSRLPQDLNGGYFSYSFWLYVSDDNFKHGKEGYRNNEWKSIFYRGSAISSANHVDLSNMIQYPGFWLSPNINNLVAVFQDGSIVERIEIDNILLNQWFNVCVVVETKSVTIYINGFLDRSINLNQSVKMMNNYDLYLTSDQELDKRESKLGGFKGNIAELIYFNYALTPSLVYSSYLYYKNIVDTYQHKIDYNNRYNISNIVSNSDYYEMCGSGCKN